VSVIIPVVTVQGDVQSTVFPNKIEHKIAGQVSVMFFAKQ